MTQKDEYDEDQTPVQRRQKSTKDEILDETFKKAEMSRKVKVTAKRAPLKKPFLKSGIVLIIVAIITLAFVNYIPWMFINYDAEYGTVEEFFYKDFENKNYDYHQIQVEIKDLFASSSNESYAGITKNHFTDIPGILTYALIILILLGSIFTIFEIIDLKRGYSLETVDVVQTTFLAASIVICVLIIFYSMKFLSSHFLWHYNYSFIGQLGIDEGMLIFIAPIVLIFIAFGIIRIAFAIMKANLKELLGNLEIEDTKKTFYRYRSKQR
jgi:hypothetical protein